MKPKPDGSATPPDDRWDALRECPDCGLFQSMPERVDDETVLCVRCGAVLRRARSQTIALGVACALLALLLLLFAFQLPVIELHVHGRYVETTGLGGPSMLTARGEWELGLVVIATLIAAPVAKPLIVLVAILGARLFPRSRTPAWIFGWLERVSAWAMVDVFILGVVIATTRLKDWGRVELGPALAALVGVALTGVALDRLLDRDAVWLQIDPRLPSRHTGPESPGDPVSGARLIACASCQLVNVGADGERCARCAHELHVRKVRSLSRTWALTLAAALLYIPANVLPVMDLQRMGDSSGPSTILRGVQELVTAHLWVLAVIVVCASVAVPLLKLVGVSALLVMTRRGSRRALDVRTRSFRFIRAIGRWSMVDIFVLSILVALVRLGVFAVVLPCPGAIAFCAVVVVTMGATECFDPRLMWDAAGANRAPAVGPAGTPIVAPPELDPA